MIKSNFHTHSIFCDGDSTVEQMVNSAIEKGFTHLGFSGHSYMANADVYTLNEGRMDKYINAVLDVKKRYEDKLKIFLGIEQDCFSAPQTYPFEYSIGSVHNIKKDGKLLFFDIGIEETKRIIDEEYNGKYLGFAKDYFATVANVIDMTGANIIGHIDLCSKFNERLSNAQTDEYLRYAEDAVASLIKTGAYFEINTGAMARGYRTAPYPSIEILKMIYDKGGKIVINSDCHDHAKLDFAFEQAQNLAKNVGYTEHYIFDGNGFIAKKFD